ncbi:MAG: hypothetical protein IPN92_10125 [Chromatiaceae bacterium]|nr:hypothetical protein [Chromatiaceae bacterium]
MPDAITRRAVLNAFQELPEGVGITTLGLAWLCGCPGEHRVRAAVSWLCLGGLVELAGDHWRRDCRGRAYRARLYRWTGRAEIRRVAQDPEARRFERDQASDDCAALALAWLSRPPPGQVR